MLRTALVERRFSSLKFRGKEAFFCLYLFETIYEEGTTSSMAEQPAYNGKVPGSIPRLFRFLL